MKLPAPTRKAKTPRKAATKRGGARPGAGQPAYKATEADRSTVIVMVACGITHDDIAACLGVKGIDAKTLRRRFARELRIGVAKTNALCGVGIVRAMQSGEAWALRFWAATRMGFSDKAQRVLEDAGPGMLWDEFVALYKRRSPATNE